MKRVALIFMRALYCFLLWPKYVFEFNISVAFWMCWAYILPSKKNNRYQNGIAKYFYRQLRPQIEKYKKIKLLADMSPQRLTVWTCWLDGESAMPELVYMCYQRLKKMVDRKIAKVTLITLSNYEEYIDVPEYIVNKFKLGIISPAHFSDVIRFCLLSKYGGLWVDSTVYVSNYIPADYISSIYYTQKAGDSKKYIHEPSRAQWCGFIIGGNRNNLLFSFVRDALFQYWKNHSIVIDYIFFDYIIKTAYENVPTVRAIMDAQEPNNEHIWDMWQSINKKFDPTQFEEICCNSIFHKLTYKTKLLQHNEFGVQTFYGYLIKQMGML